MARTQFVIVLLSGLLPCLGCVPGFKVLLPERYAVKEAQLIGQYYATDPKGRRHDVEIVQTTSKEWPYKIKGVSRIVVGKSDPKNDLLARIYSIDGNAFLFLRNDDLNSKSGYMVGRMSFSKTQIVFEPMQLSYLKNHPERLPTAKFVGFGEDQTFEYNPSSEQLAAFLTLYGGSDELFNNESPILLNRVGT